jgi:hypothetical protein
MLVGLGFAMIAVFMYLILSKRLTPVVALILVPAVFGILVGAAIVPKRGHRGAGQRCEGWESRRIHRVRHDLNDQYAPWFRKRDHAPL